MKKYRGVIIEESLRDKKILGVVKIISTRISPVTAKHQTPDLKQWTLHTVEISPGQVASIAQKLSRCLRERWYADFDDRRKHYIIFPSRVFKIDMKRQKQYDEAKEYGITLGIPPYQVDFHPKERKEF